MKVTKSKHKVKIIKPTIMSDSECFLRVGVPDNLATDIKGPCRYGMTQDAIKGPTIPHNRMGKMGKKGCY